MRKFLVKIFKYLSPPFGICILILFAIGIYKQQDFICTKKRALFEKNKPLVECLITGSSHALSGIDPKEFNIKTINIAEVNKPFLIDAEIIEKNLKYLPRLKYVIIPVDYFTLHYTGSKDQFTPKLHHHWALRQNSKSFSLKNYHIGTCGIDLNEKNEGLTADSLLGFKPQNGWWSEVSNSVSALDCKKRIRAWHENWIEGDASNTIHKRLVALIKLLEKNKVSVVLVTMPVIPQMKYLYDKTIAAKNKKIIAEIISETKCIYVNLEADISFNDLKLFYDQDHLNPEGAKIASGLISGFCAK